MTTTGEHLNESSSVTTMTTTTEPSSTQVSPAEALTAIIIGGLLLLILALNLIMYVIYRRIMSSKHKIRQNPEADDMNYMKEQVYLERAASGLATARSMGSNLQGFDPDREILVYTNYLAEPNITSNEKYSVNKTTDKSSRCDDSGIGIDPCTSKFSTGSSSDSKISKHSIITTSEAMPSSSSVQTSIDSPDSEKTEVDICCDDKSDLSVKDKLAQSGSHDGINKRRQLKSTKSRAESSLSNDRELQKCESSATGGTISNSDVEMCSFADLSRWNSSRQQSAKSKVLTLNDAYSDEFFMSDTET